MKTVLLATRFHTGDLASDLRARFPGVKFVEAHEGDFPPEAGEAEVAYTGPNPERLRALLGNAPRLRWIHTVSAGVDSMLIPEIVERDGLVLTNNSGAYDASIAEFCLAAIFAAAKRLPAHFRNQLARRWREGAEGERHADVRDATVVIVGMGSIGGELARLASAVGMRVIGVRRSGRAADGASRVVTPDRLAEIAREADYLVVTAPLTSETRGLVSRAVIAALPRHAWVVNIARGPIVDEDALYEAVRDGRVGGAGIDAWWEEPLPPDSRWWDLDNVILTPHRSFSSPRLSERSLALFAANLRRYLAGQPLLNVVDKRAGY